MGPVFDRAFVDALCGVVETRLDGHRLPWWRAATTGEVDESRLMGAFSGAARRLGHAQVELSDAEQGGLRVGDFTAAGRPLSEVGRWALLLSAIERMPAANHVRFVAELYRTGDLDEKCCLLRALPLLPDGGRFVPVAAEGIRTSTAAVLAAIACDNPYPHEHLSEEAWNQMIMKAVFNELPLARVVGLAKRCGPELARMAQDFADERRAAGRVVPADLKLIAGDLRT